MRYRPWGPLEWVLNLTNKREWKYVGTIGTEERSLCSWAFAKNLGFVTGELFSEIHDRESEKYRDRVSEALSARHTEYTSLGGNLERVLHFQLMTELFRVQELAIAAEQLGDSIILDITSYPKKFFFVLLRDLLHSDSVRNLVITYTSPGSHPPNNEPLYEDPETWKELPGFGATSMEKRVWITCVGFLVESLSRYVGDHPEEKMKILLPFPGPLDSTRRIWQSVADLDSDIRDGRFEMIRVDTIDLSSAFDRIVSLARPSKAVAFAPLGPKPISAAMCLYAIQKDASVHYPQPTVYHPEYSRGIFKDDPARAVNAYWVKHDGENLYAI